MCILFPLFLSAQNYIWTEYLIPKSLQPLFDKFQRLIDGMYEKLLLMRSPMEFVFLLFVVALHAAYWLFSKFPAVAYGCRLAILIVGLFVF